MLLRLRVLRMDSFVLVAFVLSGLVAAFLAGLAGAYLAFRWGNAAILADLSAFRGALEREQQIRRGTKGNEKREEAAAQTEGLMAEAVALLSSGQPVDKTAMATLAAKYPAAVQKFLGGGLKL